LEVWHKKPATSVEGGMKENSSEDEGQGRQKNFGGGLRGCARGVNREKKVLYGSQREKKKGGKLFQYNGRLLKNRSGRASRASFRGKGSAEDSDEKRIAVILGVGG